VKKGDVVINTNTGGPDLKSWDGGDDPVWEDLNTNWSTYGKTAVSIDYTTYSNSDFTYPDLVNSKANVMIISDAAGGTQQWTTTDIAARTSDYAQSQRIVSQEVPYLYPYQSDTGVLFKSDYKGICARSAKCTIYYEDTYWSKGTAPTPK